MSRPRYKLSRMTSSKTFGDISFREWPVHCWLARNPEVPPHIIQGKLLVFLKRSQYNNCPHPEFFGLHFPAF